MLQKRWLQSSKLDLAALMHHLISVWPAPLVLKAHISLAGEAVPLSVGGSKSELLF
jgi:hypothetical protein